MFIFQREEIARQFYLPERQSKIDTLLKQDGQAYCICRSSDSSRFMIACDACEEWYHGDCIKISEKEAKLIKQYFCVRCMDEDNTLQTRWKTKRDSQREQREQRDEVIVDERKARKRKERAERTESKGKKCGDCAGCWAKEDCGSCDICVRKSKHGGNRQKEKCKQRICVNYAGWVPIKYKTILFSLYGK